MLATRRYDRYPAGTGTMPIAGEGSTMASQMETVPQARIDTLVVDAVTGRQRRRTEYAGTIWYGPRPQVTSFAVMTSPQGVRVESPTFLPDSLPYRPAAIADALISCTASLQTASDATNAILDVRAGFTPDPRGGDVCWLQIQVLAAGQLPLAVSYRVVALVAPEAVVTATPGSGSVGG